MAKIIDGTHIANGILNKIKTELTQIRPCAPCPPGLALVMVGNRKDSETYVRIKHRAAQRIGINSVNFSLPENTTQLQLHQKISELNQDPAIHGVLVQMPLPKHLNEEEALEKVARQKDVDGLHPASIGLFYSRSYQYFLRNNGKHDDETVTSSLFEPCTALGVMGLLKHYNIKPEGKRVVVLGRSKTVGLPIAHRLCLASATLTVCHTHTVDVHNVVREGEIVIAACGQPQLVRGSWLQPGAVVIDVGVNPIPDSTKKLGYRLVGDVAFDEAKEVASYLSPVPGGVGPMTIAMLMSNTMLAYRRTFGIPPVREY